jgi:ERCC4-type nuclease
MTIQQDAEHSIEHIDQRSIRIVDSREPGALKDILLTTGWSCKTLYSADFSFFSHSYQKVGITRKAVPDLLASMDQTFSKQLEEMADYFDIKIILIEGMVKVFGTEQYITLPSAGLQRHTLTEVRNWMRRWGDKGFGVERTNDLQDTAHRLNELYSLYQKPYSLSARSKGYSDERLLALPSGLRGASGKKLLQGRSLQQIASMTTEELTQIEGIGAKRADTIVQHFQKVTH